MMDSIIFKNYRAPWELYALKIMQIFTRENLKKLHTFVS